MEEERFWIKYNWRVGPFVFKLNDDGILAAGYFGGTNLWRTVLQQFLFFSCTFSLFQLYFFFIFICLEISVLIGVLSIFYFRTFVAYPFFMSFKCAFSIIVFTRRIIYMTFSTSLLPHRYTWGDKRKYSYINMLFGN